MKDGMDFERSLEPCRRELVAYCRHLLWNKADLEDAVQEVLLQAFRAFRRFAGGDSRAWLFQVATHTVFNLNRKRRDRPADPGPEAEADLVAELGLEEAYEAILTDPRKVVAGLEGTLREGLELLNDTERAVFLLRAIGDFKYQEIASTLAIPLGSVMGSLSRARVKLRRKLTEGAHAM